MTIIKLNNEVKPTVSTESIDKIKTVDINEDVSMAGSPPVIPEYEPTVVTESIEKLDNESYIDYLDRIKPEINKITTSTKYNIDLIEDGISVLNNYNPVNITNGELSLIDLLTVIKGTYGNVSSIIKDNDNNYLSLIEANTLSIQSVHQEVLNNGESINTVSTNLNVKIGEIEATVEENRVTAEGELNAINQLIIDQEGIILSAVQNELNVFGNYISSNYATLNILNDSISSKVGRAEFDELGNTVSNQSSSINQLSNEIDLKVSETTFNELGQKVSTNESNINLLSNKISLIVTEDDNIIGSVLIGAINDDDTGVAITGDKVIISGETTFDAGYNPYNKSNTFISEPTVPYFKGDSWLENGIIKTCKVDKPSGVFDPLDWIHELDYGSEAALNDFINNTYTPELASVNNNLDKKIEYWFQGSDPRNDPDWGNDANREGDVWYDTISKLSYRYTSADQLYTWELIRDQATIDALANAATAQDTADGKRTVFTATPISPYKTGDLWLTSIQPSEGDIYKCIVDINDEGFYDPTHWVIATKYTDDTELTNFVDNTYIPFSDTIQDQVDNKIEYWFQDTDPMLDISWGDSSNRVDDVWHNTITNESKRFNQELVSLGTLYTLVTDSDFSPIILNASTDDYIEFKIKTIDSNFIIGGYIDVGDNYVGFVRTANTAHKGGDFLDVDLYIDDILFNGDNMELKDLISDNNIHKIKLVFNSNKFNISILNYSGTSYDYTGYLSEVKHYNKDSILLSSHLSDGTEDIGDPEGITYNYTWEDIKDADALKAIEDASNAQDTADGKRRVFTSQPVGPYDIGDLWLNSLEDGEGDLYKCTNANEVASYISTDWRLATKYTDDSTANSKSTIWRDATVDPSTLPIWGSNADRVGDVWHKEYDFGGDIGVEVQPHYWTEVSPDVYQWVLDVTKIDGGRMNTGSITADKIVVDTLFAETIYSSGAKIGGVDISPAEIEANGINGLRLGNLVSFSPTSGQSGVMFGEQGGTYKLFIGNETDNIVFDGGQLLLSGYPMIGDGENVGISEISNYFKVINKGQANEYLKCKIDFASSGEIVSYALDGYNIPTLWEAMPIASNTILGAIKVGNNLTIDQYGYLNAEAGSTGVSSWNDLTDRPSWLSHNTISDFENDHRHDSLYLGITAKADDSDKLDGYHASSFTRKDEDTTISGAWTFGDNIVTNGNINVATTITGGLTSEARLAGLRFILSSGYNYIQSSTDRVSDGWADIRIGRYGNSNTKVWIGSNGVRIGGSGYVTSAPSEALDVIGNVKASVKFIASAMDIENSTCGNSHFGESDKNIWLSYATTGKLNIRTYNGSAYSTIANFNGSNGYLKLGDGNTATEVLDVDGNGRFVGDGGNSVLNISRSAQNYAVSLADSWNRSALRIKGGGAYNASMNFGCAGSGRSFIQAQGSTTDSDSLVINPFGGYVGIGTSDPTDKLTVNGDVNWSGALMFRTSDRRNFYQNSSSSNSDCYVIWNSTNYIKGNSIVFRTGSDVGVDRMFINDIGNVGINTTTPTEKLTVNGNIQIPTARLRDSSTNTILENTIGGSIYIRTVTGAANILIADSHATSNVGIGTNSPTEKLDVSGNIKATGALCCSQTSGTNLTSGLSLYLAPSYAHEYGIQFMKTSTGGYGTHGSVTSDWAMYFNMGGTSSNYQSRGWLFRNNYNNTIAASISGGGDITAVGEVTSYSDRRLKSELEVIKDSLNKIKKLSGYTYTKDNRRSAGVIAQEVQNVLPEAIHGKETKDTYLSVNDAAVTGLLIECIKELIEKVKTLEERM